MFLFNKKNEEDFLVSSAIQVVRAVHQGTQAKGVCMLASEYLLRLLRKMKCKMEMDYRKGREGIK